MTPDPAIIARTLHVFCQPGQVVSVQSLNGPRQARSYCTADPAEALRHAVELDAANPKGVYFTLNPLQPDFAGTTSFPKEEHVVERRWLPIDVDPWRPSGASATDAEAAAAWAVLERCRGLLDAAGVRNLAVGYSGNGWQAAVPVLLPCGGDGKELVRQILKGLHERCADPLTTEEKDLLQANAPLPQPKAGVGKECHDARRIWCLYGTMKRKGESTAERPHRMTFLHEGEPWNAVVAQGNVLALQQLLELWRYVDDSRKGRPAGDVLTRAKAYLAKEPPAVSGQRGHDRCFHVACVLVKDFALTIEQALEAIQDWNARCVPPWSEKELRHKLESAAKHPGASGRFVNGQQTTTPPPIDPTQPLVDRACDIPPRVVEWLWPGVVPLGKLTTFAGVGGLGKTFVLCDVTARVTTGAEWPHSFGDRAPQGQVLFISGEDDPDDTLVPRLMEMGADLSRITFLKPAVQDRFTLADLATLQAALRQTGDNVRLVVIDPPTAYLGGVDDHKNSELRGLLTPLASLAHANRLAMIFNTHVNKAQGKVDAMMRVMGSVAWVNAVRAAHLFVRDPSNRERRLFLPMKMNLGRERRGMAYVITPSNQMARVDWIEEVDVTADDAVNQNQTSVNQQEAEDLLRRFFTDRAEVSSTEIFDAARVAGIGKNTLHRAKNSLGVTARQKALPGGGTAWYWYWSNPSANGDGHKAEEDSPDCLF